jgi:hypothetical protein
VKVSPKVSPTTYIGRRVKERRSKRVEEMITNKTKVNDFLMMRVGGKSEYR